MELLSSLPPELAVLADLPARGPAPLLRPPDDGGAPSTAANPFELCLALLTGTSPSGERWPPAGKELPVLPLAADPESDLAGELVPLTFAPAALAEAALQARLSSAAAPAAWPVAAGPRLPPADVAPSLPASSADGAATPLDSRDAQAFADFDPLAALRAAATDAALLEAADAQAATTPAKTTAAPSWLEAFTAHERRAQRPSAAAQTDARAAAPPAVLLAANPPPAAAVDVAAELPAVPSVDARVELPKNLATLATAEGASSSVSSTDWLPPATGHAAPTTASSTSAASLPQTPLDTRSPSWHEAFANRVQWIVDTDVGEARIKLNPPELGAVDVKISLVDDKTYVQLTTATAAARDELTQSLPRLRELLTVSGLELGGASVQGGRDHAHGGHGYGREAAAAPASPFAAFGRDLDDPLPILAPRRSQSRIDVFA